MLNVVKLEKHHDKEKFDCGNQALNQYLKQYANQHAKKGISTTYVLIDDESPNVILGFYCLSAYAINNSNANLANLPKNEIASALIGRFAIDKKFAGKGLSNELFIHAFATVKKASELLGIVLIVVDAKNKALLPFYQKMGFVQLDELRLVLPVKHLF